jgi:hypothetical protein
LTIRFWPSSLSTMPRMRVGVPAGGGLGESGPNHQDNEGGNRDFSHHSNPGLRFSREDSQEMAHPHPSFPSHSSERRRCGCAVRKARNGNPSTSRCCSPWSTPRREAIKSTARHHGALPGHRDRRRSHSRASLRLICRSRAESLCPSRNKRTLLRSGAGRRRGRRRFPGPKLGMPAIRTD